MKIETITSRERVIRTLNHEPVDRIPIDLGSHPLTGISVFAYRNLREYPGLSTDNIWVHDTAALDKFKSKQTKEMGFDEL